MVRKRNKQAGFIVSAELMLIATILVIGLIVGWVAVRDALTAELHDVAESLGGVNQSFDYQGIDDIGTTATVVGSIFVDQADAVAGDGLGIAYTVPPLPEVPAP